MCGLAGFLNPASRLREDDLQAIAMRMGDTLRHRGPDDRGIWVDPAVGVALAHRRLNIIDLSPLGRQPMHSADGRHVIIYNGEVYNFAALRRELESIGQAFRGRSDTEVALAAIRAWGVEAAVARFVGMFAFAVWDTETNQLTLVRDRLGIKPMYYGWAGDTLLFGSELKAFREHPDFLAEIDPEALTLFFRYGYVPSPFSIYRGIRKLQPGHLIRIDRKTSAEEAAPSPWWSLESVVKNRTDRLFDGTEEEVTDRLHELLGEAVRARMIADVPLGAFLSSGVDSSLVTALMQAHSTAPIRTYTIGFDEDRFDEAPASASIARHLGTEHTELYVAADDAREIIPEMPRVYDEPFGDSSQLPTCLVSALARPHITVGLSGDGGDELFGGYEHYAQVRKIRKATGWIPESCRHGLSRFVRATSSDMPGSLVYALLGRGDAHKLANVIGATFPRGFYRELRSVWDPANIVMGAMDPDAAGNAMPEIAGPASDFSLFMMYTDTLSYLPDDILTKVDRASMRVGLEMRVPLLDHRVVEFVWGLPAAMRTEKRMLRRILDRYVPSRLMDVRKRGFAVPMEDWLRGPLREWAETLLNPEHLQKSGFLRTDIVSRRWSEHVSGRRNWERSLWLTIMFQAWLDAWHSA